MASRYARSIVLSPITRDVQRRSRFYWTPYLLIMPVLLSLGFLFYNIGLTVYESLRDHKFFNPTLAAFNNLGNYKRLFTDPMIALSLQNSLVWVAGTVFIAFILGFILALLLNQDFFGRGIYRALVLSPWAISGVVAVMMWAWILNGNYGILNDLLVRLGLPGWQRAWLADPKTAMLSVIISSVWRGVPFFAVTILAALQAIPMELYEAAVVDGAGTLAKFWYVTLPMIKGVLVITTLLRTVWAFNWIENIYAMTGGGPGYATTTWAYYLFRQFFDYGDIGYACAMGVILMIGLLIFSVIYLKLTAVTEGY
jgi:multiple sugar transport system permease protein